MENQPEEQCYPITVLPHTSALFRDFTDARAAKDPAALRRWYPTDPFSMEWAKRASELGSEHRAALADALKNQAESFGAGEEALANIEKLRNGAAAVVTGQQVGLFGGPLLTLLKAATAIRKAQDATRESGREHVPVFWLASEDHDLAEVDQVSLLSKTEVETITLELKSPSKGPVGVVQLGSGGEGQETLRLGLAWASELLGGAPICDLLRECYAPRATLAEGFGRLLTRVFAAQGLIVMDAASRRFHALGAAALRYALEHAEELEVALLARSKELETAGYHAQVLVVAGHSLLFLIDAESGARLALRRGLDGAWKAGSHSFTTAELLAILDAEPERLSPNALLRPVFQDCILPTAAYVGGPAEIAYFAQSAVVYEQALGRVTPVLPRLSATLIEPSVAHVMARYEVQLPQIFEARNAEGLAQRLGARVMPIESKRKLAAVGNAMDAELAALTEYLNAMSAELGRAAGVSASKMRYQMARLRRLAATFELQKEASLRRHAEVLMLNLFPDGQPQERVVAGVWFLARYGEALPELLVEHAGQECPGHRVIYL
ncbi:MAG: bacillithiol biosynthesis cysteine-adding enzyme BshC [Acidobacteriota bacterium]|nr:bacillithiol biosynthesis cysteine-adding enzyme BshC [Acidobacteriota bacterium]